MKVGEKFLDLFTLGHLLFGFLGFIFTLFFLNGVGIPHDISKFISLQTLSILSIVWEFFENCTEIGMYLRPIKHKDTLRNSLSDIIFSILGSYISFFLF